ncbi:hypothetical protein [Neobacillus dielmonensis]|uniref:hypothetical protein n=1 Tax=Neobacillus dielmonensis TaxID=1347369 RepID=UPI0005AB1082|nr:hypothetical protein [Neobacillus dielmonensis]
MAKQAVQLTKKNRTKFRFQKLKMCKKCNRYSVLKDHHCPTCGSTFVELDSLIKSIVRNKLFNEACLILILVCIGIVGAPTVKTLYYSLIAGLVFCLLYVVLTFFYFKSENFIQLKLLLRSDLSKIKSGIHYDTVLAEEEARDNMLSMAYEKYREIGDFILNDAIKLRQVKLLNDMILRSDMELEIEGLVPSGYDPDFVTYTLEAIKINRSLVTKKCIGYFVQFKEEVIRDFGMDSLITVAGTALRMKLYIMEFSEFIEEYLDYFPKERVLRLCSILHANPDINWGSLGDKTKSLVSVKYNYDPDFKRFVS